MKTPEGWAKVQIGEICDLINGRAFKPSDWGSEGLPIIRIKNLNKNDAIFNFFSGHVDHKFIVENGDLLFAWSGTPGTSFGAHIWVGQRAVLNQHIFNVKFDKKNIDSAFLRHAINQTLDEQIAKAHGGVGLRHVTKGKFEDTLIHIPPLAEQRQIVAKIDSLSAQSKRARVHLDHVRRLVDRYKGALLDAAFTGKLSNEADSPVSFSRREPVSSTCADLSRWNLHALPHSWRWVCASDVAGITGGLTKNAKRQSYSLNVPYLRVANVYSNKLILDDIAFIGCSEREFEKTRLCPGDLLIVEGNGSLDQIGRVAIWGGQIKDCVHQNHLIRAKPKDFCLSKYLLYWMISSLGRSFIEEIASSSSGLHTLSISKIESLPVPLCSLEEQMYIVRQIEAAFTWIDRLSAEATSARKLIDHLDQAILSKAFRGELVPQDPDDEPASVLLERIKEKNSASPPAKRGRGRPRAVSLL